MNLRLRWLHSCADADQCMNEFLHFSILFFPWKVSQNSGIFLHSSFMIFKNCSPVTKLSSRMFYFYYYRLKGFDEKIFQFAFVKISAKWSNFLGIYSDWKSYTSKNTYWIYHLICKSFYLRVKNNWFDIFLRAESPDFFIVLRYHPPAKLCKR